MARLAGHGFAAALWAPALAASCSICGFSADLQVTTTSDNGLGECTQSHCTLREAVIAANATTEKDIIYLPAGIYVLALPGDTEDNALSGDLDILEDVELRRDGSGVAVVDANGLDRVFDVHGAGTLAQFFNMTIRGGELDIEDGVGGGGVLVRGGGAAYFWSCRLEDNAAITPEILEGGAVLGTDGATVFLADTTVTGNTAHYGSAIAVEDGSWLFMTRSTAHTNDVVYSAAVSARNSTASLINSTVVHNTALTLPAGIVNSGGEMTIDSCTVGYNTNVQIRAWATAGGLVRVRNTAVLGSCTGSDAAGIVSECGNLAAPGTGCNFTCAGDRTRSGVGAAGFGPLGSYGGPTPVCPPSQWSPAVDWPGAEASCQSEDQRGFSRPRDGDHDGTAVCDIGAAERRRYDPFFSDGFESGDTLAWH